MKHQQKNFKATTYNYSVTRDKNDVLIDDVKVLPDKENIISFTHQGQTI
jgi:hypothetical protein